MRFLRTWVADERGVIALKFALAVPALALLAVGAIDLRAVAADRALYQQVAEAAALTGARELALAVNEAGPIERAETWGEAQLAELGVTNAPNITASVIDVGSGRRALKVAVSGKRPSFFGNLLPPGGWHIDADATASAVSTMPLCVLTHSRESADVLKLKNQSKIDAPACLLHSNGRVKVDRSARITAGATQARLTASGSILAAPHTGAPPIDDPYIAIDFRNPTTCPRDPPKTEIETATTLQPGLHCGEIKVKDGAQLTLAPGEHWFGRGLLKLEKTSWLVGTDVVMIFDGAAFEFKDQSRVSLTGRKEGKYAGFVIVGLAPPGGTWCGVPGADGDDADDDEDDDDDGLIGGIVGGLLDTDPCAVAVGSKFTMASDNVDVLEGVVYTPAALLIVTGKNRVAEAADWTVMIARRLEIVGSPTLVINANYGASDVPVPDGVGNKVGKMRLIG